MSLIDLRAYFKVGNKTPCNAERPEQGPQLGWLCTLPIGHKGKHIAHDLDGSIITAWKASVSSEPDVQDAERDDTLCAEHRDGKPGARHEWRRGRRGHTVLVVCNPWGGE